MVKEGFFERNPTCGLFLWLILIIIISISISEYGKDNSSLSE